jgi:SAM-dependent methyltransferase
VPCEPEKSSSCSYFIPWLTFWFVRISSMKWKLETVPCAICSTDSDLPLFKNDSHGFGLQTVMCSKCGLVYLNPRPTPAEYERLYSGIYEKLFPSAWNTGESELAAERRFECYHQHIGSSLLEVGPGDGSFLSLVSQEGVTVSGIDLSPYAVNHCQRRGLNVRQGYFAVSKKRYASIAAFHVLEHSLDPVGLLRQFRDSLEHGGRLFIEVPNILGKWTGLGMIHIAHPVQFCPDSLQAALHLAGFEVIAMTELEERPFESSLRVLAVRSKLLRPPSFNCQAERIQATFRERLSHWKTDLFKYRVKRAAFNLSGLSAIRANRLRGSA